MIKALIFGVSKYKRDDWRDLWGVQEDLIRWQRIVKDVFAVAPEETRLLFDDRCTKPAIFERLQWLFDGTTTNDTVYLIYGGHGAQFASRDQNGLPSQLHECLVPFDFTWDDPLTDQELASKISQLNTNKCNLICIFDCCHSGGLTRGDMMPMKYPFIPEYPREIILPTDIQYRVEVAKGMGMLTNSLRSTLEAQATVLCACAAEEKAWESWVDGDFRGIFSFSLEKAIATGDRQVGKLIEASIGVMRDRGFKGAKVQTPFATNPETNCY